MLGDQEQVQEEIRQMLSASGFSRSKLTALLKEIAPEAEKKVVVRATKEHAPCTVYKEIKKNYTCLHCGEHFSRTICFKPGEDSTVIDKNIKVVIINSKSPAEIDCVTSRCSACTSFIKKMSREELEERYLQLLSCTNSLSYNNLFGNKFTTEEREIKL